MNGDSIRDTKELFFMFIFIAFFWLSEKYTACYFFSLILD
jgi:hypothetical protein